jgi:hypothetical protein
MAAYGLIGGIGKGLSQGASIVSQGMAQDREVKLQQMREASVERRWKAESDLRASQRAEDVAFRNEQANTSSNQFNRQQTSREKQVIEANLNGILEQQNKEELAIRKHYEKMVSDTTMDLSAEEKKAIESEMINAITSVRSAYDERLQNMVGSYGDQLKGTGFEYLLTVKPESPKGEYSDVDKSAESNSITDYVASLLKRSQKNAASLDNPLPEKSGLAQRPVGLLAGFMAGVGGMYNNNSQAPDYSKMSPANKFNTGVAFGTGKLVGAAGDFLEVPYDHVVKPAYNWLTTAPEQGNKK